MLAIPLSVRPVICMIAAALALAAAQDSAVAQTKLEVRYGASVAGLPVGTGTLIVDIDDKHYSAVGKGRVGGLLRVISRGEGSASALGIIERDHLAADRYALSLTTERSDYEVQMVLHAGSVKGLMAEPPVIPSPDRVPLTEAHRRGIIDPMSAILIQVAGSGETLVPAACERTLPIFDGHQRFNLTLWYKRIDLVKSLKGYEGPVVVCGVTYQPVAGHRPDRFAVRYIQQQRDIEVWLAPVAGTRLLAPYRVSVPTLFGNAILQASEFETVTRSAAMPTDSSAAPLQAQMHR